MAVKTTGWPSVDKLLQEAAALQKEFVELDRQIDKHLSKQEKPLPSSSMKKYKLAKLSK